MGIEPYLLASTLNLVVAQRLIRKICPKCKEPIKLDNAVLKRLNITENEAGDIVLYHGRGCNACGQTGYHGRLPIFEFLPVDDKIAEEILSGHSEDKIRKAARQKGYMGLYESGISKVKQGLTTAEEILRVASSKTS